MIDRILPASSLRKTMLSALHAPITSQANGMKSAALGDLVVPGHRTEWGSRSFAVAGPKCWNKLPVGLRDLSVGPETFARRLKTHLFRVGFSD